MVVTFEIEYEEARELRNIIHAGDRSFGNEFNVLSDALTDAIDNENERRWDAIQERLMESGGIDDSAYRAQLYDAGRGHLLR